MFVAPDWTAFRTVDGLCRKGGVPSALLYRLVLKELTDNAMDAAGVCEVGETEAGYFIQDDGPGLPGGPDDIARLFSIARPLMSTKLLRLPTRGALGNGLRIVAGAVLATGGTLVAYNRGNRLVLQPRDDGHTDVEVTAADWSVGTRIEVALGPRPDDPSEGWADPLLWARIAALLGDADN